MNIIFDPRCFADFEGTQEELDELVAEITAMFKDMTPEELESMSVPVSDEDIFLDIADSYQKETKQQ